MNGDGQSDGCVVPATPSNKALAAEAGEERRPVKGNTDSKTRPGRGAGQDVSSALGRVRQAARRDRSVRFTALLHHVGPARLRAAYWALRPQAAPGVDGVTWAEYGKNLEDNIQDLHARVQSGRYRAKPSRRAFIPKADGRLRPLGIAALEDKIVQRATVEVLNAVYEGDFRGFSYGFRPGRSPHDALDALAVGIYRKKVNWVLDADIRDFFGQLDRVWLRRFLQHRIADRRVLRLIDKWLAAGVIEEGKWSQTAQGSVQGGLCSAEHNAPNEQRWVMHSAGPMCLVKGGTEGRTLRIILSVVELKVGEPVGILVPFEQFVSGPRPASSGSMPKPWPKSSARYAQCLTPATHPHQDRQVDAAHNPALLIRRCDFAAFIQYLPACPGHRTDPPWGG